MRKSLIAVSIFTGLSGVSCGGATYNYVGYLMDNQFPLDGTREYQYLSDDESIETPIRVEKASTPTATGTYDIYTFETYNDESGDLLNIVDWSSDSVYGILIHGFTDYANSEDPVVFDPPLIFADDEMAPSDFVVTQTGGMTFTSTFVGVEPCPNYYVAEWNECLRMELDDGDGDANAGSMLAGTYWLVPRYGIAWFQQTGDAEPWVLWKHSWTPE